MPGESNLDLWWKNAIVYCVDVEVFLDSNADGIGDFRGLTERVDYLAGLGVTCIWLMPFYPSPNRDDGYDICDYYSIDEKLGDMGDFTEFIQTANAMGIKVIVDLVVNHTSIQHPWFEKARRDPDSPFRNYYVWAGEPPDTKPSIVFPGEQKTNWTYDEVAKQYYFHHFYPEQPDLNPDDQAVVQEMKEIMGFWIQQGLAGFRVDAVPFLIELRGGPAEEEMTPHGFLKELRSFITRRRGDSVLLGEVNLLPHEQLEFFGDNDQLEMIFSFYVNQHFYLALAREDPDPLRKALTSMPPIPPACQWANFVKNHDEQNLDKLTEAEREEVFAAFAPKPGMQSYGRGMRRRLPAMLGGDQRKLRLAYSLMFSLPGTPVLFYGEEIGMGENLDIKGRLAVRTPMQWKGGAKGGFSNAAIKDFVRPLPKGDFSPDRINVADQRKDENSLLNWMERLIRRRKETAELGFGTCTVFDCGENGILAHSCNWDGRVVIALHNFTATSSQVSIEATLDEDVVDVQDIWSDRRYGPADQAKVEVGPYGYRWLRVIRTGQELLL